MLIKASRLFGIMDIPNHRSLHNTPKPRTGGIAVLVSILLGFFLLQQYVDSLILAVLPYALLVAGIAFVDDIISISALWRLLLQVIVAFVIALNGLVFDTVTLPGIEIPIPSIIGLIVTVLFIVWMVNLYNFMDGMDGFSGGMAIIGFGTFAIMGFIKGDMSFGVVNLIVVAGALGFLVFNLPPSKIFLGDVGATLFGMFVALFILWADTKNIFPAWIGIIVFLPFILDSTVTLFKRILRGEKVWIAHCSHYYQRLVLSGLGHKKTLILELVGMLVCSLTSLALFYLNSIVIQISLLILFTILCITLLLYIDKITNR